jgi:hypothetical protein
MYSFGTSAVRFVGRKDVKWSLAGLFWFGGLIDLLLGCLPDRLIA